MRTLTLMAFAALVAGCSTSGSSDDMDTNYAVPQLDTRTAAYLQVKSDAPLDPSRKISEQDCTAGVSDEGGNLRCK